MASGRADFVKIQSSDGEVFDVPIKVAMVSRTLSVMLKGTCLQFTQQPALQNFCLSKIPCDFPKI